ncbi:MAG: hypothetical protein CM15mP62_19060 [Rhodospirillaceae bacterium]|nr:MAG: hypothetical protein CM15mP62_19060 [Rhodospirillaceae bacterium]
MSIGDIGSGLYATIGVQARYFIGNLLARPQKVDIGMLDCQLALLKTP